MLSPVLVEPSSLYWPKVVEEFSAKFFDLAFILPFIIKKEAIATGKRKIGANHSLPPVVSFVCSPKTFNVGVGDGVSVGFSTGVRIGVGVKVGLGFFVGVGCIVGVAVGRGSGVEVEAGGE